MQTGKPRLLHGGSGTWHTCEQVTQAKRKPWDIVMRTGVPWLPVECPGTWKSCQQAYLHTVPCGGARARQMCEQVCLSLCKVEPLVLGAFQ